jgi:hypothetical protein
MRLVRRRTSWPESRTGFHFSSVALLKTTFCVRAECPRFASTRYMRCVVDCAFQAKQIVNPRKEVDRVDAVTRTFDLVPAAGIEPATH